MNIKLGREAVQNIVLQSLNEFLNELEIDNYDDDQLLIEALKLVIEAYTDD